MAQGKFRKLGRDYQFTVREYERAHERREEYCDGWRQNSDYYVAERDALQELDDTLDAIIDELDNNTDRRQPRWAMAAYKLTKRAEECEREIAHLDERIADISHAEYVDTIESGWRTYMNRI